MTVADYYSAPKLVTKFDRLQEQVIQIALTTNKFSVDVITHAWNQCT